MIIEQLVMHNVRISDSWSMAMNWKLQSSGFSRWNGISFSWISSHGLYLNGQLSVSCKCSVSAALWGTLFHAIHQQTSTLHTCCSSAENLSDLYWLLNVAIQVSLAVPSHHVVPIPTGHLMCTHNTSMIYPHWQPFCLYFHSMLCLYRWPFWP